MSRRNDRISMLNRGHTSRVVSLIDIAVLAIAIGACTEVQHSSTPTLPAMSTISAISTPHPDVTSTNVVIPPSLAPVGITSTPVPVTPAPTFSANEDFPLETMLFDANSCEMPCWDGLMSGKSSASDTQRIFEAVFGSRAFSLGDLSAITLDYKELADQYYARGHQWIVIDSTQSSAYFALEAAFTSDKDILQVLKFIWYTDTSNFTVLLSPQRVIKRLGSPSHILVSAFPPKAFVPELTLMLVYDNGIVFEYWQVTNSLHTAGLCFDKTRITQGDEYLSGDFYIMESFKSGLDNLTPIQAATVGRNIEFHNMKPIEEIFEESPESIVARILQDEDVCLPQP